MRETHEHFKDLATSLESRPSVLRAGVTQYLKYQSIGPGNFSKMYFWPCFLKC